jgi:hypothetical protein
MTTDERSAEQSAEAQVSAYWHDVSEWWDREYDEEWISATDDKGKPVRLFKGRASLTAAWDAALAFTLEHQEQCRCLEQEIFSWNEQIDSDVSVLRTCYEIDPAFACSVGEDLARVGRTVERLQAALSELKRGTRGAE